MEKVVKITSLKDIVTPQDSYWLTKTYEQRLQGLETMRIHAFSIKDNGQYISSRLQRVCFITH